MINTITNSQNKKKDFPKNIKPKDLSEKNINNKTEIISNHSPENKKKSQKLDNNLINIIISKDNQNQKIRNNKEINNIDKDIEKEKLIKAQKRLNILNLLNSDNFAENYMYYPCKNEILKFQQNSNYSISIPYSGLFYDNILLRDESIFFVHDKTQQLKFLDETDIKKINSQAIKLNFGEDPSDIYYQILRGNYHNKNITIEQLQKHLYNFNLFKCRIPNYMNINIENFRENELYNLRNNYLYNEQGNSLNESLNSTRINSGVNKNNEIIQFNQREFILNNEIFDENITNKEDDDNNKKKFINKKRKNK